MKKNSWHNKIMRIVSCLLVMTITNACSHKLNLQTKHIVFISGEEEYRSEESLPMIAKILQRETGARVSFCFSLDSSGYIDPNNTKHISCLDKLTSADLVVMFCRFRALPPDELSYITDYIASGKPIIGLRTSTHSFLYKDNPSLEPMNNEWPTKVFGQQWITHHGHFDDGKNPLTSVSLISNKKHAILSGVKAFDAYSWLYHVDGGDWKLNGDCYTLLNGRALKSNHEVEGQLEKFPLTNPVAWTKTYTGSSGKTARVFFTTLGHPYDFRNMSMRKLLLNGIYWALDAEKQIPKDGVNAQPLSMYEPGNSGFGNKYKKGVRPEDVLR